MCSALKNREFTNLTELAEDIFKQLDGNIVMGVPIGVGKATHMINAFYQVAKANRNTGWKLTPLCL